MDSSAQARIHDLLMDVVRAAGLLQFDQGVPGHVLSVSQAFALHELDGAAPLSQQELAERLGLEKSSVSRMAAEMERRGLLARERDPANRRLYRLRLTERGRDLHSRMGRTAHARYERWISAMTPAERDALLVGLPALLRAIQGVHAERDPPGR